MRILFLGSGAFGLPTLGALASAHEVVGVVTQPDRPAGRGRDMTPTPIGAWAGEHLPGVPLLKPENIDEGEMVARVRAIDADAWVVIAFGQKLGRPLLKDRFAINLHASLLPRWRGAAPINAAILAGDAETGNSVITLADRMDAGEILGTSRRAIEPLHTAGVLHDLLAAEGPALVLDVLARHSAGSLRGERQDESLATRAPKLSKADGWVDFGTIAEECRRRVHGLTPWPGVTAELEGITLKLALVEAVRGRESVAASSARDRVPGRIVDASEGLVSCGGGTLLRLLRVTPAGKREMDWGEFARGRSIKPGAAMSCPSRPSLPKNAAPAPESERRA
ncbi:MAG: methionyl-tRNA formyltransferase [Phycisphaerales bacterium]|nr:methionyl-tRNA formyltransferase [Phycisphaerales bacterium]